MKQLLIFPLLLGYSVPAFAHNAANGGNSVCPKNWVQKCARNPWNSIAVCSCVPK